MKKQTIYAGPLKVSNFNGELSELKGTQGHSWTQVLEDGFMATLFKPNGVVVDEDDDIGSENIYLVDPENLIAI